MQYAVHRYRLDSFLTQEVAVNGRALARRSVKMTRRVDGKTAACCLLNPKLGHEEQS